MIAPPAAPPPINTALVPVAGALTVPHCRIHIVSLQVVNDPLITAVLPLGSLIESKATVMLPGVRFPARLTCVTRPPIRLPTGTTSMPLPA